MYVCVCVYCSSLVPCCAACLLSSVVPDVAGGLTEEKVSSKGFEVVFAFDEVITTGGHKESITLQQVGTQHARCKAGSGRCVGDVGHAYIDASIFEYNQQW